MAKDMAPDKYHNPYHFVPACLTDHGENHKHWLDLPEATPANRIEPFRRKVIEEDTLARRLGHDSYQTEAAGEALYSGRLICRLTNCTPMFIGGRRTREADDLHPAEVAPFELEPDEPALPASSLRGLITSIAEAASGSSLRVLHDGVLSYRKEMRDSLSALGMVIEDRENKDKKYRLFPLTLPTLTGNEEDGYRLQDDKRWQAFKGMFPKPHFKLLIGKHKRDKKGHFTNKDLLKYHTYSEKNQEILYLKVKPIGIYAGNGNIAHDPQIHRKKSHSHENRWSAISQWIALDRKPLTKAEVEEELAKIQDIETRKAERGNYTPGIVRILAHRERTDISRNKTHEVFIPLPADFDKKEGLFEVLDSAVDRLHKLADERTRATEEEDMKEKDIFKVHPYHPKGTERNQNPDEPPKDLRHKLRLKEGDIVYFNAILDGEGKPVVDEIAFSSIWRGRVEYMEDNEKKAATVWRFFEEIGEDLVPFHAGRSRLSPAELLFGFVQEDKKPERREGEDKDKDQESLAYAGRVHFSFGHLAPDQCGPFYALAVTLKILSSPKPPSPALYFKHKMGENRYIPKADVRQGKRVIFRGLNLNDHIPQGRKFYLHHRYPGSGEKPPWETWKDKELEEEVKEYTANLKQKMRITPIAPHKVFYFHVDFTNLSAWELGLLCYALRPAEKFRHKLGMGKPIGLGTVEIEPEGLFLIDRKRRYGEQDLFDGQRYHAAWFKDKESIKKWPSCYLREREAAEQELAPICAPKTETAGWEGFRALFAETLDPHVGVPLELLGDPHKPQHPIHTPQVREVPDCKLEEKTYRWFVANDIGTGSKKKDNWIEPQRKPLVPLDQESKEIPYLTRHEWRGD